MVRLMIVVSFLHITWYVGIFLRGPTLVASQRDLMTGDASAAQDTQRQFLVKVVWARQEDGLSAPRRAAEKRYEVGLVHVFARGRIRQGVCNLFDLSYDDFEARFQAVVLRHYGAVMVTNRCDGLLDMSIGERRSACFLLIVF